MSNLIFRSMSPQDGYKRLKRSNKKFLLRESRILGMLTIDMVEEDSCRFGFIESDGWVIVSGMEIEEFTKKIKKVTLQSSEEILENPVVQLLDFIYRKFGYQSSDMLRPTEMESTRVSIYRSFVLPKDYEEKISCPVSMRSGNEIKEVAFLFGQIYEYKYIRDWVLQNGTCPLTRYPATLRDIKKSNTINRILHHNK